MIQEKQKVGTKSSDAYQVFSLSCVFLYQSACFKKVAGSLPLISLFNIPPTSGVQKLLSMLPFNLFYIFYISHYIRWNKIASMLNTKMKHLKHMEIKLTTFLQELDENMLWIKDTEMLLRPQARPQRELIEVNVIFVLKGAFPYFQCL